MLHVFPYLVILFMNLIKARVVIIFIIGLMELFTRKILYFHENQLIYPVQQSKERDFQYGYNQVLSALGIYVKPILHSTFFCFRSLN